MQPCATVLYEWPKDGAEVDLNDSSLYHPMAIIMGFGALFDLFWIENPTQAQNIWTEACFQIGYNHWMVLGPVGNHFRAFDRGTGVFVGNRDSLSLLAYVPIRTNLPKQPRGSYKLEGWRYPARLSKPNSIQPSGRRRDAFSWKKNYYSFQADRRLRKERREARRVDHKQARAFLKRDLLEKVKEAQEEIEC